MKPVLLLVLVNIVLVIAIFVLIRHLFQITH